MSRGRWNKAGMSLLGAVIALMALGVIGVTTATLMGTHQESRSITYERHAAQGLAQAGLEYALMQITNGGYPNATKSLGQGQFTVQVIPAQHLIRSTATFAAATQVYQIVDNFLGGDCVSVNNAMATLTGPQKDQLQGITLVKTCLNAITVDKWIMTWVPLVPTSKVIRITMETPANVIYDNPAGAISGELIDSTDYTMSQMITQVHMIKFSANMSCRQFAMQIFFTDGSSATMPQTLLGTGICP